ncbi:MAG: undecaprenyl-diphosphate phosphatase [Tidjanibacter sp.]|nr:undecaprenyl-diphosphate phosphatase [Tidjanibacter sp.]MBQ2247801.1 undecaprenyl-diphosphate phosphatase [Tidjanibacter sp.]
MSILESFILGLVQGLTEYLPVSSSGHLQIAKELLGVELTDNIAFDVILHFATVLSTIVVLWPAVKSLLGGFFSFRKGPEMTYALKIIVSMIPVGIVGLLLKDDINALLASDYVMVVVGAMLLLTALLLLFAHYAKPRNKQTVSWGDAMIIGASQAVATMPGLSRSGTTIATGLILGNRREVVAEFSFLMVILPIVGESMLDLLSGNLASVGVGVLPLVVGFATAFVSGCLACKFMLSIVNRGRLVWFALYCLVVGIVSIGSYIF